MPFLSNSMLIQNMRMTDMILHELAIKTSCNFNPDKDNLKEVSKDSMQCLVISDKKESKQELQKIEVNPKLEEETFIDKTFSKLQQNFIPYPDHNYGQQPPLTPPSEKNLVVSSTKVGKENSNVSHVKCEGVIEQDGVTKCICGFDHDDGYMICCDKCSSWQHIECMGISKVPKKYSCYNCSPRELDVKRAKEIQTKKRENMSEDDDEDDDEGEDSGSEEESANKASYTIKYSNEVTNTPTRITLQLNNTNAPPVPGIKKGRKGGKLTRKKFQEQRTSRRKTRRKEKGEAPGPLCDVTIISDVESFDAYISSNASYERIEENKCDEELKNMHFKLPEVTPSIDFQNIVKLYQVAENQKGLIASSIIPSGNFILEYLGTLVSLKTFEEQNPNFLQNCPYVIKYTKIGQFPVVIDARKYGNDARFLRRSCCANAELKHLTINGSLHIMIISVVEILKDQEITVPFDQDSDLPGFIDCACGQENCPLSKTTQKKECDLLDSSKENQNIEQNIVKTDMQDHLHESENEGSIGEDSRHEKLSREERKLQAVMKQFEKMEKKQDASKHKVKDAKPATLKVSNAEEQTLNSPLAKPCLVKKLSGKRRSISFNGKRRTRQSSCSSEPVSPIDHDHNSDASTPNSFVGSSTTITDTIILSRQKGRKDKEPLTLTLPIQRKMRNENSLSSPTPPCTPSIEVSPVGEHSNFSLTVDTQLSLALESTPVKTNHLGLLQIANRHGIESSQQNHLSTAAIPTSEEKIGNLLSRSSSSDQVALPSPYCRLQQSFQQRKYYGSLKKHWLRKHVEKTTSRPPYPLPNGSSDQVCLAALMATLDPQRLQETVENSTRVFKRPHSSYIPLKKRHLRRAMQKLEIQNKIIEEAPSLHLDTDSSQPQCIKLLPQSTKNLTGLKHPPIQNSSTISKATTTDCLANINCSVETSEMFIKKEESQLKSVTDISSSKGMGTSTNIVGSLPRTNTTVVPIDISPKIDNKTTLNTLSHEIPTTLQNGPSTLDLGKEKLNSYTDSHILQSTQHQTACLSEPETVTGVKRSFDDQQTSLDEPDAKKPKPSNDLVISNDSTTVVSAVSAEKLENENVLLQTKTIQETAEHIQSFVHSDDVSAGNDQTTDTKSGLKTLPVPDSKNTAVRILSTSSSLTSPRTSLDSNPDLDLTNGPEPATVKRKLSIKDYLNRRSQKVPTTTSTSQHSTSTDHVTHPSQSTSSIINQAADTLLIPKTVSLCGLPSANLTPSTASINSDLSSSESELYKKRSYYSSVENAFKKTLTTTTSAETSSVDIEYPVRRDVIRTSYNDEHISSTNLGKVTNDYSQTSTNMLSNKKVDTQFPNKRSSGPSSNMFEPVSPSSDEVSKSPKGEPPIGNTIHTDITKNPSSTIHNSITKHPFAKKHNQPPGLLQYLSAQKFPHLATITNNANNSNNSTTVSPNSDFSTPHQHNAEYHNMIHENNITGDNDEDTSSNHSSISSTSFGSGDMIHDRSYNYHRSSTTSNTGVSNHARDVYGGRENTRDYYSHNSYGSTTYYPTFQTFNQQQQQQQQQQQHPQTNRQPNAAKRTHPGFLPSSSSNAYTSQSNHGLRRPQPHNRFHHF